MGRILKGTDPEYFVLDEYNKPVPAYKVGFPDKHDKMKLRDGFAFRDGYAVEINVTPSARWDLLTMDVRSVLQQVCNKLPKGFKLLSMPAVKINLKEDMEGAPLDMLTFGCDPSLDAYTGMPKLPDIDAMEHPFRYAGGHLHFSEAGVTKDSQHWINDIDAVRLFVRVLDVYIGLPLTVIFDRPQTYLRRRFYGQAGEFRHQHYSDGTVGVEYRTPGPEVFNHPAIANLVLTAGSHLFENFERIRENWSDRFSERVREAINTGVGKAGYLESLAGFYSSDLIRWMSGSPMFMSMELPEHLSISEHSWIQWVHRHLPEDVRERQ